METDPGRRREREEEKKGGAQTVNTRRHSRALAYSSCPHSLLDGGRPRL
jgi:hypothetical protein